MEAGAEFRLACYLERILFTLGPLEVAAGADLRHPGGITPYTAIGYYGDGWWAVLELGDTLQTGAFRVGLSVGGRL